MKKGTGKDIGSTEYSLIEWEHNLDNFNNTCERSNICARETRKTMHQPTLLRTPLWIYVVRKSSASQTLAVVCTVHDLSGT